MKLRNLSNVEQKCLPHTGPSFSAAAGEVVEVDDLVALQLELERPAVWVRAEKSTPKKSKKES